MRNQISNSILKDALSVNIISNGVELDIFKPVDKKQARAELGLPVDGKILLYVAHRLGAYRKGFHLASKALMEIQENNPECPMLITMGSKERLNEPIRLPNTHHFGYVEDPRKQSLIYSAADAFLCTTLAEGQPQTILESMACGTPVIAFNTGPMPEEVSDGENGFLVEDQTASALAGSIRKFLNNEDIHPLLGVNSHQQALEKYNLTNQTEKYITLYERILNEHQAGKL
jgi:glycosyltransferase involved in cell wall biosynthesis